MRQKLELRIADVWIVPEQQYQSNFILGSPDLIHFKILIY